MQILHRLHKHQSRSRVDCIAVLEQCTHKERQKQHEERHRATNESYRATRANVLIVHVIHYIQYAKHTCQEHYGKSEYKIPGVEQGVESCRGIGPTAYDGSANVGERCLLDNEVGTVEECGYCPTQQQRAYNAVQYKKPTIGARAEQIALAMLELIAHRLQHKREEYYHPQPVGSAKAGAVEQWERGEEGSAEGYECGEGYLPLATGGFYHLQLSLLCATKTVHKRVGTLNEEQKHEQCAEQRHYKPPVLLKKCIAHKNVEC